jgi:hypothetical protein
LGKEAVSYTVRNQASSDVVALKVGIEVHTRPRVQRRVDRIRDNWIGGRLLAPGASLQDTVQFGVRGGGAVTNVLAKVLYVELANQKRFGPQAETDIDEFAQWRREYQEGARELLQIYSSKGPQDVRRSLENAVPGCGDSSAQGAGGLACSPGARAARLSLAGLLRERGLDAALSELWRVSGLVIPGPGAGVSVR